MKAGESRTSTCALLVFSVAHYSFIHANVLVVLLALLTTTSEMPPME